MAETEKAKEQVRPLAASSPSVVPAGSTDEEEATTGGGWRSIEYLRKRRRCCLRCCGCCGVTVVVLGIAILVLSLTVFKVKDPSLTMNSISLARFSAAPGDDLTDLVLVNATLVADISLKNPNVASFRFGDSATEFYYGGETVGVAYAPAGRVGADKTTRMNVTVDVLTDRVARQMNMTQAVLGGEVNLTSFTDISGRVSVLGLYKRHIEVTMNCSITLSTTQATQATLTNNGCSADVK